MKFSRNLPSDNRNLQKIAMGLLMRINYSRRKFFILSEILQDYNDQRMCVQRNVRVSVRKVELPSSSLVFCYLFHAIAIEINHSPPPQLWIDIRINFSVKLFIVKATSKIFYY